MGSFIASTAIAAVVFISVASGLVVDNLPCGEEVVQPNLLLNARHHIFGVIGGSDWGRMRKIEGYSAETKEDGWLC
jgi:hypothetical protein